VPLISKREALLRIVPAGEDDPLYLAGWVRVPVYMCQHCGFRSLGVLFRPNNRPCKNCADPNWKEPRQIPPRQTNKSKHDKRTLVS
jgi:hypothetical protein